jgi:hypothetical protein
MARGPRRLPQGDFVREPMSIVAREADGGRDHPGGRRRVSGRSPPSEAPTATATARAPGRPLSRRSTCSSRESARAPPRSPRPRAEAPVRAGDGRR